MCENMGTIHRQFTLVVALLVAVAMVTAEGTKPSLSGRIFDMAMVVDAECRNETDTHGASFTKFMVMNEDIDQKYKCYISCIMKKFSGMSHGGEFNLEEELLNVPEEVRGEGHIVIHSCKHIMHDDPCETAYRIHKCYFETNTKLYTRILTMWYAKTKQEPPKDMGAGTSTK